MANKANGKSGKGMGCLVLFSLPFAGVGVGMAVMLAWTITDHLAMRGWEEVPAVIVEAELEENRGDDGSTYRATAKYVYTYNGRQHTGSRVSLHGGADNIGSFQKNVNSELSGHKKSGEPFRCYVDPEEPEESILYRQLRWEMVGFYTLFVLVFGGAGFGLLIGGVIGLRKKRTKTAAVRDHPEEPWRWKEEWTTGQIRSSSKTLMVAALLFAAFWNLISAPLWFILPGEVFEKGNRLALLGWLFPAVGIGLALWALWAVLRWRKYGESVFEMAQVPGVVGGKLAGVIHTSVKIDPDDGFRVSLLCIRKHTSGSGKNRQTHETVVWQDERVMARELSEYDYARSAIPVLFGIPYGQPETSRENDRSQIIWRLEVKAAVPGIDYAAAFVVPVFKTSDSREDFELDESLIADYTAEPNPDLDLSRAGVIKTLSPAGPGTRYIFPMARHFGTVVSVTIFFLFWTGAIGVMLHLKAPLLFPVIFGLIDLLLAWWVADLWLYRSVVDVSRHEVAITGGLLGLGRTRRVAVSEIRQVTAERGMQSGRNVFYNVFFGLGEQKKLLAGKRLKNKAQADAVLRELKSATGGPSEE